MNRTATFLAIATAVATLASAAVPTLDHADAKPKQSKQQRCLTKGKTVVRDGQYRLYVVVKGDGEQFYFACSSKIGRHVPVFEDCCDQYGTPFPTFSRSRVTLETTFYDEGGGSSSREITFDLRTGKKVTG
jgi:hypothetical protein